MKTISTIIIAFICLTANATDKESQLAALRAQLRNAQYVAGYMPHADTNEMNGNVFIEKKTVALAKTFYGGSLTANEKRTILAVERCKELAIKIKALEKK